MNELLQRPVLLTKFHDVMQFDCGVASLNLFLQNYALQNINNNSSRSYVAMRGNKVVGYYSLAYGSVSNNDSAERLIKGLAKHPVPIMLLARLAVDKLEQRKELGRGLMKDAFLRTLQAAEIAGLRAILAHAKDERAKIFYEQFGFEPMKINPLHLYLLTKDIKNAIEC